MATADEGDRSRLSKALERIRSDRFLGEFATPLPALLDRSDDVGKSFDRMSELLGTTKEPMTVRFTVDDGQGETTYVVESGQDGARVSAGAAGRPDLEVIVAADTWGEIARGEISPIEAFGQGRMRVRGDVSVGWRLLRKLRGDDQQGG